MIEDAVVLVVVENERGLCPHLGIGCNRIDLAGDKRRAIRRHVIGMFRLIAGGNDPGDRGQPIVPGVVFKLAFIAAHHCFRMQRRAIRGFPKDLESLQ